MLGDANCGATDLAEQIQPWFDATLPGRAQDSPPPSLCFSLDADQGATGVAESRRRQFRVSSGVAGSLAGSEHNNLASAADQALFFALEVPEEFDRPVIAGIPNIQLSIPESSDPAGVVFVGVGLQRGDELILIDDQVTPIRTDDPRLRQDGRRASDIPLVAVAESLQAGDRLGLLLYAQHDQYENEARTLYVQNAVEIDNGTFSMPIFVSSERTSR